MSVANFQFFLHREPHHGDSLENLHASFVADMQRLDGTLSWRSLAAPALPDFRGELIADYEVEYSLPSLSLICLYTYRGAAYTYRDEAFYDDKVIVSFNVDTLRRRYETMLHQDFVPLIKSFGGYLARGLYADYATRYQGLHQGELEQVRSRGKMNVNGRNNIFSLQPVQYWGDQLCQNALGYNRDEVIRRLKGKVPRVEPLIDGVYVVFSDNPDLTFEEYCAYNDELKPVLGLA